LTVAAKAAYNQHIPTFNVCKLAKNICCVCAYLLAVIEASGAILRFYEDSDYDLHPKLLVG